MTKETKVEVAPTPVMRTDDREDEPEKVEIVEDVEVVAAATEDDDDTNNARAGIYKRHSEKRDEEIANQGNDEEGNEQIGLENSDESNILQSDDDQTSTPPDEDPLVEVVVFEAVRMVPQSKVDKAGGVQMYQMREAAQEQMRRNSNRTKELDTRETALDDRDRHTPQPPAVPSPDQRTGHPPTDLPSDDQTLEAMARQYQDAVYDNADNAPLILTQMVKTAASTGTTFNQDEFRQQVTKDVLGSQRKVKVVKARSALIDATPALDKNNPKFDHRLFQAMDDETDVVERRHPEWEPDQVIAEAWKKISKWKGGSRTDTMETKQRSKQELNRPSSGTGRFTPPPPEPRTTNSDYVRNQRVARGLEN